MTTRTNLKRTALLLLTASLLAAAAWLQPAAAAPKDKEPLLDFTTGEPVAGAFSQLERSTGAVATKIRG